MSVDAFIGSCAGMLAVEGWVEVSGPPRAEESAVVPTEHKGVQTEPEEPILQTPSCGLLEEEESTETESIDLELPAEDRSLQECLEIYKSEVKICLVSGSASMSEASLK
jgi:hypothetical protein